MWPKVTKLPQLLTRCLPQHHPSPPTTKNFLGTSDLATSNHHPTPPHLGRLKKNFLGLQIIHPLSLQDRIFSWRNNWRDYAVYHKITIPLNNCICTTTVCPCDKLKQYFLLIERLQFFSYENIFPAAK